eukprot:12517130-Prorocentrum_lima.AAC.1
MCIRDRHCAAAAAAAWGTRMVQTATAISTIGPVISLLQDGKARRTQLMGLEHDIRPINERREDPPSTIVLSPASHTGRILITAQLDRNYAAVEELQAAIDAA